MPGKSELKEGDGKFPCFSTIPANFFSLSVFVPPKHELQKHEPLQGDVVSCLGVIEGDK